MKCESEDLYNGWTGARTDVEGESSTTETAKQGTCTVQYVYVLWCHTSAYL
jgi:hypothetical protein